MRFNYLITGLALVTMVAVLAEACQKDNNPPVASKKADMRYELPQGNASFDSVILNFYHEYNTYILYRFSDVDFNYQLSYNLATPPNSSINSAIPGPVLMRGGDSIAIPAALDFMNQYWFGFYPEGFKKQYLPQKILLAGLICNSRWNGTTRVYDTIRTVADTIPIEGMDAITLPKIDTAFITLPLAKKLLLKAQLNKLFLKHLMDPPVSTIPALISKPADFFNVSDYTVGNLTNANKYKYGFIYSYTNNRAPTPDQDLLSFLDTICAKPKSALDANMLNPKVDSLGLTAKKYSLLVNYFMNNYNVDIQAIGNKQN
jgi:hypothetical protein